MRLNLTNDLIHSIQIVDTIRERSLCEMLLDYAIHVELCFCDSVIVHYTATDCCCCLVATFIHIYIYIFFPFAFNLLGCGWCHCSAHKNVSSLCCCCCTWFISFRAHLFLSILLSNSIYNAI